MKPLSAFPAADRAKVRGILTDIDDTLTTHGRLTAKAYAAMEALTAAGIAVIPITGRPAGWCDHIARMWPVAGVVGENGAFWMRRDPQTGKLVKRFLHDDAQRAAARDRLQHIAGRIMQEVPGCAVASDQRYRESDLAIDWCEDVPALPLAQVDRIVAIMQAEGLTAKVSSIHVNGWFGDYDKLGMTRRFMAEALGVQLDAEIDCYAFIGDSPNDAPMFRYFTHSVGVANVRAFADRLEASPRYVTDHESGAGFAEFAQAVLSATQDPALRRRS